MLRYRRQNIAEGHTNLLKRFGVIIGSQTLMKSDTDYIAPEKKPVQVAEACQIFVFARDMEAAYGSDKLSKIALLTRSFSLSPFTTFDNLLRSTCSHWGLIQTDFSIFQLEEDSGKLIDLSTESQRVLKYLETYAQTNGDGDDDQGDKNADDAGGDDKKFARFYIGRKEKEGGAENSSPNKRFDDTVLADQTADHLITDFAH